MVLAFRVLSRFRLFFSGCYASYCGAGKNERYQSARSTAQCMLQTPWTPALVPWTNLSCMKNRHKNAAAPYCRRQSSGAWSVYVELLCSSCKSCFFVTSICVCRCSMSKMPFPLAKTSTTHQHLLYVQASVTYLHSHVLHSEL